jgi:hypothetical protein
MRIGLPAINVFMIVYYLMEVIVSLTYSNAIKYATATVVLAQTCQEATAIQPRSRRLNVVSPLQIRRASWFVIMVSI